MTTTTKTQSVFARTVAFAKRHQRTAYVVGGTLVAAGVAVAVGRHYGFLGAAKAVQEAVTEAVEQATESDAVETVTETVTEAVTEAAAALRR